VVFFPTLHRLGKDSLWTEAWRLGVRTGSVFLKEKVYGELYGSTFRQSAADSVAIKIFQVFDSLRQEHLNIQSSDSPADQLRETFRRTVASLVFQGHPATANLRKTPPMGLDTSDLIRRTLDLALRSDLSLAQIVQRWTLRLDYLQARAALSSRGFDSLPLNPFRLTSPLALDTLHQDEPPTGLWGTISARLGIQTLRFTLTNDSGDRTERFAISDAPRTPAGSSLTLSGHPTLAATSSTPPGRYTLRMTVIDSLGNQESFRTNVWVKGPLDHQGPQLELIKPTAGASVVLAFADSQLVVRIQATDTSGIRSVRIGRTEATREAGGFWEGRVLVEVSADSRPLEIVATDSAGNLRSTQILVRRDPPPVPTAPRLHLVKPAPGTLVPFDSTGTTVVWTANTDFGKVKSVTIAGVQANNTHDSTWEARVELSPTGKTTELLVRAQSTLGLVSTESAPVGRKPDTAGPLLRWVSPTQEYRVAYDMFHLQVVVAATDLSGVDSVHIGGKRSDSSGGVWMAHVALSDPGTTARIPVKAWDHVGNQTDSALLVARDPIPHDLAPTYRWIQPTDNSKTVIPFDSTGFQVVCVFKDISGMDASSVKIGDVPATRLDDTTWTRRVELPPTGKEVVVTLEGRNTRGKTAYSFVGITRRRDTIPPHATPLPGPQARIVPFDSAQAAVGWTLSDNDRIAKAWIQDQEVSISGGAVSATVPLKVARQWVRLRAEDPAGNLVRDSVSIERRPDSLPPRVTRGTGASDQLVPFDTTEVPVEWTASDNDRVANGWIQGLSVMPAASGFASRVPLSVGAQWVKFLVEDPTGNTTRDSIEVRRMADTTKPRLAAMPHNKARTVPWDTSAILVGWTASDNDRIARAWIQDVEVVATSEGFTRMVPLATGIQWIRFKVQDPTGNLSLDSFRMERLAMDTVAPVTISDTNSQLRAGSFLAKLSTTTPGARIHYTLDGSEPTEASPEYGTDKNSFHDGEPSLWIDTTVTVKARAFATNRVPGRILTQAYQLALPVAVSGGADHSLFLLSDGSLWGAGSNLHHAFSPLANDAFLEPIKIADSVVEMSAGREFSVWIKKDGSLWGIGANDSGNLGVGTQVDAVVPVLIRKQVSKVAAFAWRRILVLDQNADLWGAGDNYYGQIGSGSTRFESSLVKVASDVHSFGGGEAHTYFLKRDGTLWAMGAPWNCRLGFWSDTISVVPTLARSDVQWIAEKVGNTSFAMDKSGALMAFGDNTYGAMGTGDTQAIVPPRRLVELESKGSIVSIASHFHTLALTASGDVWGSGMNDYQQAFPSASQAILSPQKLMTNVKTIAAGLTSSFAITKSGELYVWGNNQWGQLGLNTVGIQATPARVKF